MRNMHNFSPVLLTDLYELTMACGYWKSDMTDHDAAFHLYFRKHPFKGGYTIACGLGQALGLLDRFRLDDDGAGYLRSLEGSNGRPLFDPAFVDYLRAMRLEVDIDAMPEGTVVFPQEPLVRVRGPVIQAQLLETVLLNVINFQTLIATKAARICSAARGEPVLEFGLRRAQGIDGGLSASRAAYVGGCAGTSNVLAGQVYGIPVKGTHAHSWVMCFDDETEAFEAYARAMPNNCVFLVDTYDTLEGVRRACEVGRRLRARGHEMVGIRLDSGDLAWLSIEARRILDEAGFPDAAIVASNDLDEHVITSLKQQDARINVWGVGTRLATAYDEPALGGVYKLSAIRRPGEAWQDRVKLSEQLLKVSTPGSLQVRRFITDGRFAGDMIYNIEAPPHGTPRIVDPVDPTRQKRFADDARFEDLLVPVMRGGELVYDDPGAEAARERARAQLDGFDPSIRRFMNPHEYPVGLEPGLHGLKLRLVREARGTA